MTLFSRLPRTLALSVFGACLATATAAAAQSRGAKDSGPKKAAPTTAELSLGTSGAIDDNGGEAAGDVRDPQYQGSRMSSGVNGSVSARGGLRPTINWQAALSSGAQFYPTLHEVLPTGHSANVGLGWAATRRTTLSMN